MTHRWLNVLVRLDGPVEPVAAAVPRVVADLDPGLAVAEVVTGRQRLDRHPAKPTLLGRLLGGFAGLGLGLTMLGIFVVTAYSVTQRTTEFGIRLAPGAQRRDLLGLLLRQGLRLSLLGAIVGVR